MNIDKRKYYTDDEKNSAEKSIPPIGFKTHDVKKINSLKIDNTKKFTKELKGAATPNIYHRVLTKMGFGPTPELIEHIQSLSGGNDSAKIHAYIDEQLAPDLIDDSLMEEKLTPAHGYTTLLKSRQELFQQHYARPDGIDIEWNFHIRPGVETSYATFLRAIQSKKQLVEIMADFWHNHFNINMNDDGIPPMFVHYDRDVIRPEVLGNFRNMLESVTKSTCMLDYLGNGLNEKTAPNENFAREILELHTISSKYYFGHLNSADVEEDDQGRKIGYVEHDVVEMARALTGWSYSGADYTEIENGTATGNFVYRDDWHDKGEKTIMGYTFDFDANEPLKDMRDILDKLADHPATSEFLATKLCKRFISDNPSQSIIDLVKTSLHNNWQASNQIKLAMEVLLKSDEFLNTWGEKIKRPFERAMSAMRQINFSHDFNPDSTFSSWMYWGFINSGQMPFFWTSPNGYPDTKSAWLGASSIMSTWRFMQLTSSLRNDSNLPFNDILNITESQFPNINDRTANNIVDFWYERICGLSPSSHIQDKLTKFMSFNNTDNPIATDRNTAINLSDNSWPDYNQERLFAVVSTIFFTSEFNFR